MKNRKNSASALGRWPGALPQYNASGSHRARARRRRRAGFVGGEPVFRALRRRPSRRAPRDEGSAPKAARRRPRADRETSTAAAALAAAAVSFPRRSRRAKPARYAGGFPRSSTALMRRTPAEEDSSFLILKCPRTPVCSTCGPVQTSLLKKSSRDLPIV